MPTINVSPGDGPVLQDIADTMAKSKKVVVVTGAGISTNCGIPDFRSENGLYSLIQAQYDAAKSGNNSDTGESCPSTPNDAPMTLSGSMSSSQAAMCPRRRRVGRPRKEKAPLPDITNTNTSTSSQTSTNSTASDNIPLSSTPQLAKRISDIKGKDLFDSMVWNNHLSTSTFLTFIASLRRQIRNEVKETTDTHKFLRTLRDGGRLVRCYTQNIDGLEAREGLEMDLARGQGSRSRFSPTNVKEGAGQTAETVLRGGPLDGGVEVVGLHGGLSQLRCGLCQKLCDWDQIPRDEEEDGGNATGDDSSADSSQLTISSQVTEIDPNSSTASTTPANCGTPNRRRLRNRSISLPPDINIQLEQQIQSSCMEEVPSEEPQESSESQDSQLSAEDIFLSGSAPACPYCSAKNAKREKGGRRSLAIGRLRPDVVLYGEEHPEAHLIGPLMTHDISLSPDILLILGTSLKVHGLKVMVREFAKAVHSRGGKVVFVNRTKPPESIWGDIIDYWVEWDCDAWVKDLRERSEELWQHRGVMILNRAENRKKPKSEAKLSQAMRDDATSGAFHRDEVYGNVDQASQSSQLPPNSKTINTTVTLTKSGKKSRPAATRDCTHNAAHHTAKIHRILRLCAFSSSPPPLPPLSSISVNINRPPSPPSAKSLSLPAKWAFETKLDVQLPLPTSLPTESTRTTRSSRRSSPRLPTPPDSDPSSAQELTPRSMRRIKEKSSIQAILSSPSTSPRKRRRGN